MSVIASDIIHYNSLNVPNDDTSTVGGAIDTSSEIGIDPTDFIPGYLEISQSDDVTWYYKSFIYNSNVTDTAQQTSIYISNGLLDVPSNNLVAIYSSSAYDSDSYTVRIIGTNSLGTLVEESVALDGVNTVYSINTYTYVHRVEKHLLASPYSLSNASGNITINCGIDIGIIPIGFNTATNEVSIGLEATLDGTSSIANRLTAPGGISFTKPNILADALLFNGTNGDVPSLSAQGIWTKITCVEGVLPSPFIYPDYLIIGQ